MQQIMKSLKHKYNWGNKYLCNATIVIGIGIIGFGIFIRLWEMKQPVFYLEEVTISSIKPYSYRAGELHWSFHGYRIHIKEDDRLIDFPKERWNEKIKVGDKVTIAVRRSFFNDELDGRMVNASP